MPEFCTCGAQLPPDARFCHKCGKPQRDEPLMEALLEESARDQAVPPQAAAQSAPQPAPEPLPINLRNRAAVRAALLAGLAAFLLSGILGVLSLIAIVASGGFAVYLYGNRTGQRLSVANGARLGWITGIVLFTLMLMSFTIAVALDPNYLEQLRQEVMKHYSLQEAQARQFLDILVTPVGIAALLLGMFFSATLGPALGGAVGARFLGRPGGPAHHPHA